MNAAVDLCAEQKVHVNQYVSVHVLMEGVCARACVRVGSDTQDQNVLKSVTVTGTVTARFGAQISFFSKI